MRPIGGLCLACLSPASEKAFMTPIREARSIVLEPPAVEIVITKSDRAAAEGRQVKWPIYENLWLCSRGVR